MHRFTPAAVAVLLALPPSVHAAPEAPALVAGDVVPTFQAEGVDGVVRSIDYPKDSRTVLLFFLSSCPTCHKMLPLWSEAYLKRPKGLTVVGVMLDREPPGFFTLAPVSFPVVRSPGSSLSKAFKIRHVPLTVRVGPGGKVEDAAEGIADPIRLGQLFRQ